MNRILDILQSIRPESDFRNCHDFLAAGVLDSFDIVMLVAEIDKAYGIAIAGTEIVPENFANLDAIAALIQRHGVSDL